MGTCLIEIRQAWDAMTDRDKGIGISFALWARFADRGAPAPGSSDRCCCECCAVRQVIRGHARTNGKPNKFNVGMPPVPLREDNFQDDEYTGLNNRSKDQPCEYVSTDMPGFESVLKGLKNKDDLDVFLEWKLQVYDACQHPLLAGLLAESQPGDCDSFRAMLTKLRNAVNPPGELIAESVPYSMTIKGTADKNNAAGQRILRTISTEGFDPPGEGRCKEVKYYPAKLPPLVIDPARE
jgi:hypothetical protein